MPDTGTMQTQGPLLRGANITLDKITQPTDISKRQTKIIVSQQRRCSGVLLLHGVLISCSLLIVYSWTRVLGSRAA